MNGRRLRLVTILLIAAIGVFTLGTWTQQWFTLVLVGGARLPVTGQIAAPALSALGLASLALSAALSIAGRVVRILLGLLEILIGVLVAGSAFAALAGPISASRAAVTAAVGESGATAVAALVSSVETTPWPWLAALLGILAVAAGIAIPATTRLWPGPTRKYETEAAPDDSAVGNWDALSSGADPTK